MLLLHLIKNMITTFFGVLRLFRLLIGVFYCIRLVMGCKLVEPLIRLSLYIRRTEIYRNQIKSEIGW